jgi:quinoprotein glucose dehydrogenase
MRHILRLFAALVVFLAPIVVVSGQVEPHPGKAPYDRVCKTCHGDEGKGSAGPSLVPFTMEVEELMIRVREGGGEMPPISANRLSDDDLKQIAAYLKSLSPPNAAAAGASRQVEWQYYGGDPGGSKYSALIDVTSDNVQRLQIAWQWKHFDEPLEQYGTTPGQFEAVPLMLDGVLYVTTPYNNIAALDAETGQELWRFDGEGYRLGQLLSASGWKMRGTAFWRDRDRTFIFLNSRHRLFKLDARTGKPASDFGADGWVSIPEGLPRVSDIKHYTQSSPPVVYNDLVILGSQIPDRVQIADPVGQVQAFHARTGKRVWVFSVVPQSSSDPGAESWEKESFRRTGHGNVWAPMALDEARGLLYLPTSTPGSDYYGGNRPGANLFAESLVCLDANTGRIKWHFQTVHHGLWDWDIPAQPNLVTITVDGRRIDAVAQVTKRGDTFVFDRVSGRPIWPIVERPVETTSDVPGEKASPTQPFPTRPPAFVPQGLVPADANNLTPEIKALAEEQIKMLRNGPIFTPPSLGGTWQRPAASGGANWGGAAFDPESGFLYVRANNSTSISRVGKNDGTDPLVDVDYAYTFGRAGRGNAGSAGAASSLRGLPVISPPYAVVAAIDLNKGEIAWRSALGEGPASIRNNPLLKGVTLPDRLGNANNHGGPLVTRSGLVFVAAGDSYLYAFDKRAGQEIWRGRLPFPQGANPMSYRTRSGKQFIVLSTGTGADNALVAFALQ